MSIQKQIELQNIQIDDPFFNPLLERVVHVTAADILTKFENDRGGAITNFDRVRDSVLGEHAGPEWYDGLTYETITGICDLLIPYYQHGLDLHMDNYTSRIAQAALKDPNGYINTYTQTMEPTHRFGENGGFLRGQHDLYNAGALIEAGVHHYKATGKYVLLDTAVKFAEYLCSITGNFPKKNMVPAHSLPEEAVVNLYRLFQTDDTVAQRYPNTNQGKIFLELAEFWIEHRGVHCGLPDWENWEYEKSEAFIKNCEYKDGRPCWGEYAQDKIPVLEQETIEGHAVRAVLLFAGVAACAYENNRSDYIETAKRIWNNMALKRMHVTGGVGAIHQDEKFGPDYYLPHDAYLETCAAIGAAFYTYNMYLLTGEKKYIDCLENSIYNGILVGIAQNGHQYSYVNPLVSDSTVHRWDWHVCPCCPPMDLKFYGRLPQLIYSYNQDSVSVNLFLSSKVSIPFQEDQMILQQITSYPWHSGTKLVVQRAVEHEITLRIRIPDGYPHFNVLLNQKDHVATEESGYACITRVFQKGDVVDVSFDMPISLIAAHPKVKECENQVAIRRGPIVYCLEETDNPNGLDIVLDSDCPLEQYYDPDLLGGAVVIKGKDKNGTEFKAIPYYLWDNRESGKMKVWVESKMEAKDLDWEERLFAILCQK